MKTYRFDTQQVHAGFRYDPATGANSLPIYQTAAYGFDSVAHAESLFALKESGNIYTRIMNPTTDAFETRMAALDGGVGALATSSGHAAMVLITLNLCRAGDNLVSAATIYGGTVNMLTHTLPQYGITTRFADIDDLDGVRAAIDERTRMIHVETIGNPQINLCDIPALAKIAHEAGIPLVVDNTFGTPYLIRPLDLGADITYYSATKYIGGHGTTMGGVIVDGGKFDWTNGRFPGFTQPDPGYHDGVYVDLFGPAAFIGKARVQLLRDLGMCISPMNSWLLTMGLETLSLRMDRHVSNARKIVTHLKAHPDVAWVSYPETEDSRYRAIAQRDFPKGVGGIFAFGLKGGRETGGRFIDSLELFEHVANVADVRSLVIHPATTTHSQLSDEAMKKAGLTPDLIRVSVGIEDAQDLIEDLDQAIERARK